MIAPRRLRLAFSCLCGLLIAGCAISFAQLSNAKGQAQRAHDEHATVASAIDQLNVLSGKPELAKADSGRSDQLTRHIESVSSQVGIPSDQLEHIQTQPPRRIDGGPYLRQSKQVLIRQANLPELLSLLHDLDPSGQTLQLDELRLLAPHSQQVGSLWQAEFTVSYLIYQPLQAQPDDRP